MVMGMKLRLETKWSGTWPELARWEKRPRVRKATQMRLEVAMSNTFLRQKGKESDKDFLPLELV